MRVLIADDGPLVCQSLKTILQADGSIEVIGVASVESKAVELFAELQPDVVLMDIRMPKMTGIEAYEALKQFTRPRVLFSPRSQMVNILPEALRLGAKGTYLSRILKASFQL